MSRFSALVAQEIRSQIREVGGTDDFGEGVVDTIEAGGRVLLDLNPDSADTDLVPATHFDSYSPTVGDVVQFRRHGTTRIIHGRTGTYEVDLPDGSVGSAELADGAVTEPKHADGGVSTRAIAVGAVTAPKIPDGEIADLKLADDVRTVDVVSSLPGLPDPAYPDGAVVVLDSDRRLYENESGTWQPVVRAGQLDGQIVETQIGDDAISTPKLQAGAVTASEVAAGTLTANEIAADSLTAGVIAAGAISTSELAADAVTANELSALELEVGKYVRSNGYVTQTLGDELSQVGAPSGAGVVGLAHDGTDLWLNGNADGTIYRVDDTDGTVLQSFANLSGWGLTHDGTDLWQSGGGTLVRRTSTSDGSQLSTWNAPAGIRGLAFDGVDLWGVSHDTHTLYRFDRSDGTVLQSFQVPTIDPSGLTWRGGDLHITDVGLDTVFVVSAGDGSPVTSDALPGGGIYGAAHDGQVLYVSQFSSNTFFRTSPTVGVGWAVDADGTVEASQGVFRGTMQSTQILAPHIDSGLIQGARLESTDISGGDITGTTVTGSSMTTDSSGNPRVEIGTDANNREIFLFTAASVETDPARIFQTTTFTVGSGTKGRLELWSGRYDSEAAGQLLVQAAISGGGGSPSVVPGSDNTHFLGGNSARWKEVYAVDGTINTSDETVKVDVVDSDLGLEFIRALRRVRVRRRVGGRPHYGLSAQQVKAAMGTVGVDDFAGYINPAADPPAGFEGDPEAIPKGLRYAEFIAPLIRAVQQLEAQLAAVEDRGPT